MKCIVVCFLCWKNAPKFGMKSFVEGHRFERMPDLFHFLTNFNWWKLTNLLHFIACHVVIKSSGSIFNMSQTGYHRLISGSMPTISHIEKKLFCFIELHSMLPHFDAPKRFFDFFLMFIFEDLVAIVNSKNNKRICVKWEKETFFLLCSSTNRIHVYAFCVVAKLFKDATFAYHIV